MVISSSGYVGSCIHGLAAQKNSVLNCCHHENLVCHATLPSHISRMQAVESGESMLIRTWPLYLETGTSGS